MTAMRLHSVQVHRKQLLLALAIAVLVAILFTRSLWDFNGAAHESIEYAGLFLILVCVIGRAWSVLYIGDRKSREIVRDGPYSVTRNPLYLFSFIGVAGLGAGTGSLVLTAMLTLVAWLVFRWVVAREEQHLLARHGKTYARYTAEVPRFWPDFSRWRDVGSVSVTPRVMLLTAAEASLFFLAYPFFEAVEWAQEAGYLVTPLVLP